MAIPTIHITHNARHSRIIYANPRAVVVMSSQLNVIGLEQSALQRATVDTKVTIGEVGYHTSARCALDKTFLYEIRLLHFLDRSGILVERHGYCR